jgi:dipeptidyl aminopeptidase/acylaminoacyl peptidase
MIDSRGSYDRGLEFEGHIKYRMGTVELRDQVEGLIYLATRHRNQQQQASSMSSASPQFIYPDDRDITPKCGKIPGSDEPGWSIDQAWQSLQEDAREGRDTGFVDPFNVSVTGWSYGNS